MSTATFFSQPSDHQLVVEHLADGSAAVFDPKGDAVYSLNRSAAAVFACCTEPATLSQIVESVNEELSMSLPPESISNALAQLEEAGLIVHSQDCPHTSPFPSRRDALQRLAMGSTAAIALPSVLCLLASEQRAYAQGGGSSPLNLTGTWTGQVVNQDGPPTTTTWTATQSGSSVTGPFMASSADFTFNGTMSGTVSSGGIVSLAIELGFPGPPPCTIHVTFDPTAATNVFLSGPITLLPGCPPDSGSGGAGTLTMNKL